MASLSGAVGRPVDSAVNFLVNASSTTTARDVLFPSATGEGRCNDDANSSPASSLVPSTPISSCSAELTGLQSGARKQGLPSK